MPTSPLGPRLGTPQAIVGKTLHEIAQSDLGPELGCEARQSIRAAPRTDAAGDADHNERIEGEAVAIVHASHVHFLFRVRQAPASLVFPPPNQWICPVCAIPVIRGGLAEPVKSTRCCPSKIGPVSGREALESGPSPARG